MPSPTIGRRALLRAAPPPGRRHAGVRITARPLHGDVVVAGGTLTVEGELHVGGDFRQRAGTVTVTVPGRCRDDLLTVAGDAELGGTLSVDGSAGRDVTVLRARRVSGRFATVVAPAGLGARVSYSRTAVTVRLHKA